MNLLIFGVSYLLGGSGGGRYVAQWERQDAVEFVCVNTAQPPALQELPPFPHHVWDGAGV